MARYIDADALEKAVLKPSMFDINKDDVIALIAEIPTADVVPKSEVERLQNILNSYALQYGTVRDQQAVIDQAKIEVAMEIFAEIERAFFKYYEERVTYSDPTLPYHMREAVGFSLNEMFMKISELKKKYTEVEE